MANLQGKSDEELRKMIIKQELEEKKPSLLPTEQIDNIRRLMQEHDTFKLEAAQRRSVLLLGSTRSGKTTFVEMLKDGTYQPPQVTVFSQTKDPQFRSFSIGIDKPDAVAEKYTINVIDTPGLFEVKSIGDGQANNDEFIRNTIQECLKNEVTKLNIVIIFATVGTGLSLQDLEAIQIFLQDFASPELTVCICITRAEGYDEAQKSKFEQELSQHAVIAPLIAEHKVKLIFSGCVDTKIDGAAASSEQQLISAYLNVGKMRKALLQTIFDATGEAKLVDLDVIKKSSRAVADLAKDCIAFLTNCYNNAVDFSSERTRQQLKLHMQKMEKLGLFGHLFATNVDLVPLGIQLDQLIAGVALKYDEEVANKLVSPFKAVRPRRFKIHAQMESPVDLTTHTVPTQVSPATIAQTVSTQTVSTQSVSTQTCASCASTSTQASQTTTQNPQPRLFRIGKK